MHVFTACQISAARVATTIFARRDCQVFMEAIASKALHFAAQYGMLSSMKNFFDRFGLQCAAGRKMSQISRTQAKSGVRFRLRGAVLSGQDRGCAASGG